MLALKRRVRALHQLPGTLADRRMVQWSRNGWQRMSTWTHSGCAAITSADLCCLGAHFPTAALNIGAPLRRLQIHRGLSAELCAARDAQAIWQNNEQSEQLTYVTEVSKDADTLERFVAVRKRGCDEVQGGLQARPPRPHALMSRSKVAGGPHRV